MSFYIEKLIVSGQGKEDSVIEFTQGVNIIYGPSNTGKTYIVKCIDFLFGSKNEPIDSSTGYEFIKLIIKTSGGSITLTRRIDENKIEVSSTDDRVESGKYNSKASSQNYDKTINSVWLSLIGIAEEHKIISNEDCKKKILSWRTFCHMFMLTETKIIEEKSVLLSGHDTDNTAVLSSLIFLLTGQDFADTDTQESKAIKDAKKKAVKSYINKELFRLSERNQELLDQTKDYPDVDLQQEVSDILSQIEENEHKIEQAIGENQNVLKNLHEKNESLSECNVLLNRYAELNTQYDADLKRLSFIVDGEANDSKSYTAQCPFCDSQVNVRNTHNYIEAAKADYKKIKLQAKDLEKALTALQREKIMLEKNVNELLAMKNSTEALVEKELKPQIAQLEEKLSLYQASIERQKEISILKKWSEQKTADIIDAESEESNLKYKVKEHLDYEFISALGDSVKDLLEDCKYENLLSVRFDKSNMDIVINGKKKSSNGKGYNAYFNSIVAIVLSRYMHEKAIYSPDLLIVDSPILSLKEKESKKPSETMRNALFENIISNQGSIQTIVVENEIPDIDYKGVHVIHFTKEKDHGRYGFLSGVTD